MYRPSKDEIKWAIIEIIILSIIGLWLSGIILFALQQEEKMKSEKVYKERINLTLTKDAKIKLREQANRLGLSISAYLEYLSRQPTTKKEDLK